MTTLRDHYAGLLVLECDPSGTPPAPLTVAAATGLAEHLAKDLDRILEGTAHLGLIVAGALYDQTEVLRAEWPLTTALANIYPRGASVSPQVMALGTDQGIFPVTEINPQRKPGSGPLWVLPFCFVGPADVIKPLAQRMEDRLLQDGTVSDATREYIEEAFHITAANLSFATIVDLFALLSVQLENHGLLPLWELLEHAVFQRKGTHAAVLETGNYFLAADDHVHTLFYTFNDFAQWGPAQSVAAAQLPRVYCDWVLAQRHYALGLEAYGVHVRRVLANPHLAEVIRTADEPTILAAFKEIPCLSGDYLVEGICEMGSEQPECQMFITHQADNALGTLLYTVVTVDAEGKLLRFEHHYPLHSGGLAVIIDRLVDRCADQGAQRQVFHPGTLLFDDETRSVRAATHQEGANP